MTSPRRDVEQYGNGHGGHGGGNDLPSAIEPSSLSLSNGVPQYSDEAGDAVAEDDGPSPNYVQSSIEGGTRTPNGEPAVDPTLTPLDEDDAYMSDDLRNVDAMYGSGTSQSDLRHEVTQPKEGLSAFAASLIVVNYMSAGFLLLPGGECIRTRATRTRAPLCLHRSMSCCFFPLRHFLSKIQPLRWVEQS